MSKQLNISAKWVNGDHLPDLFPEEQATFSEIGITWNNHCLTEGRTTLDDAGHSAPLLPACHLAEWLAWNWWRLMWEPRAQGARREDWGCAHHMGNVGGGYVWPRISVFSDGERTALVAEPTIDQSHVSYRYTSNVAAIVASTEFERSVDTFFEAVGEKLREDGVRGTNFEALWGDLKAERQDPRLSRRRKLEALLGKDPDEVDEGLMHKIEVEVDALGEAAVSELAADHDATATVALGVGVEASSQKNGIDASPQDAFKLAPGAELPRWGKVPAWKLGSDAARLVHKQANLKSGLVKDDMLTQLSGLRRNALDDPDLDSRLAFELFESDRSSRIVFRSKWKEGRRFELARLIGDRVLAQNTDKLHPVTRSYTYRQKAQRAFAAELLCPFDLIDVELEGDYSDEAQQELAGLLEVSPLAIRTQLMNNGRLERMDPDDIMDVAA